MATTDRYDRQLRLWGPLGQRKLMTSHILLIRADSVGTETLKNLVLPGIGQFTILDDYTVSAHDLGGNFFVTEDSVGKPRAEVITALLCEMNPDVRGYARVQNFHNVLNTGNVVLFSLLLNLPTTHWTSSLQSLSSSASSVWSSPPTCLPGTCSSWPRS